MDELYINESATKCIFNIISVFYTDHTNYNIVISQWNLFSRIAFNGNHVWINDLNSSCTIQVTQDIK